MKIDSEKEDDGCCDVTVGCCRGDVHVCSRGIANYVCKDPEDVIDHGGRYYQPTKLGVKDLELRQEIGNGGQENQGLACDDHKTFGEYFLWRPVVRVIGEYLTFFYIVLVEVPKT